PIACSTSRTRIGTLGVARPPWPRHRVWSRGRPSRSVVAREAVEVEADEESRQAGTVGPGLDDAAEACPVEHRGDPDEREADVDPLPAGIDGVGLDARRARIARRLDDVLEQRPGDALPAGADADAGAAHRPHRPIGDRRDRSRADETRCLRPNDDATPANRLVAEVGEEPGRDGELE